MIKRLLLACFCMSLLASTAAVAQGYIKVNPDGKTGTVNLQELADVFAKFSEELSKAQNERDEAIRAYMNLQEMIRKSNAMCS